MDVVRLGERYTTDYIPDMIINGYSSMIWTERFQDPGEFELKTPLVDEMLDLLPLDTLISHQQTRDVMMVENHVIGTDADGYDELIITGRSLDFFIEHRWVEGPYQKKRKMARQYRPVSAVAVLLWNSFCNDSGVDVTRDGDFGWTSKDLFDNVCITDSVHHRRALHRRWVEEGILQPQLMKFLVLGNLGIRVIRPWHSADMVSGWSESDRGFAVNSGKVIEVVSSPLKNRGKIHRHWVSDITALRFDIHDGLDRTFNQNQNPRVSFDYLQGEVNDANYLFSKKDFKTVAKIQMGVADESSDGGT